MADFTNVTFGEESDVMERGEAAAGAEERDEGAAKRRRPRRSADADELKKSP